MAIAEVGRTYAMLRASLFLFVSFVCSFSCPNFLEDEFEDYAFVILDLPTVGENVLKYRN